LPVPERPMIAWPARQLSCIRDARFTGFWQDSGPI
jgi:hypothetical protein